MHISCSGPEKKEDELMSKAARNKGSSFKGSSFKGGAGVFATVLLLAVTLTGCGSAPDQNEENTQVLPTPSAASSTNTGDRAPGDDLAVFDTDNEPEATKPIPVPTTAKERERSENPEKPVGAVSETNALPKGTKLPASGEVLEDASRLDGYNSFVALSFDLPWEKVVEELRASLEASGWECYECIPFIPGPNAPKETERFRYFLNMEKDGHKLMTIIAVMVAGNVTASLTFQG